MKRQIIEDFLKEYKTTGQMLCLKQTTSDGITPAIQEALRRVAPNNTPFYLDITPLLYCLELRCYANVNAYMVRYGGKLIEGWMIFDGWQGRYLIFIHHAIWRKKDGSVADITPMPDEQRILFLPDAHRSQEGKGVPSRFLALDTSPQTLELLDWLRYAEERIDSTDSDRDVLHGSRPNRVGRNERCPCGSSKKYKQCCMRALC